MSILIKGMKMPESCLNCPLETDYGTCGHFNGADYAEHPTGYSSRPVWCPLIELPPHGDLIDRDALSKSLDSLCDRVCQYSKAQRKVMCGACPLGDAFAVVEDDAPTIIESEGEDG